MKKMYRWFLLLVLFFLVGIKSGHTVYAEEGEDNVSVTIPSSIAIVFNEDGTNTVSEYYIDNQSQLPMEIASIHVTECNDWELVSEETIISANTKQVAVKMEQYHLSSGENSVDIIIPEHSGKSLNIGIKRGAWTSSRQAEQAFSIEIEYAFEAKLFQLEFDSNGSDENPESVTAYNGDLVSLPTLIRFGYDLQGWEDENGNLYVDQFLMPVGDCVLTAKWIKTEAYALYSDTDQSLTFVRSATTLQVGDVYNGKVITTVYTGFEEEVYTQANSVPWMWAGGSYGTSVYSVTVEDWIRPISTSYWFFCFRNCSYFELEQLDMSCVTSMVSMFSAAGENVTTTVTVKGIGNWDTSKVTNMGTVFRLIATNASEFVIDDISQWDTSNVTDMLYMFWHAGMNADWTLDLSGWDVRKVTVRDGFHDGAEEQIVAPVW